MVTVNITKNNQKINLTNQENYVTEITNFDPSDLLAGALAKCTKSEVEKFIRYKGYDIESFDLSVQLDRNKETKTAHFKITMNIQGDIGETEIRQIKKSSRKSYIYRLLSNNLDLESEIIHKSTD